MISRAPCRREMMHDWVREKGVMLRGGGLDESPHVYRRLPEVLAAQKGTIEVLHTLRPLIVVMAGADQVRSVSRIEPERHEVNALRSEALLHRRAPSCSR